MTSSSCLIFKYTRIHKVIKCYLNFLKYICLLTLEKEEGREGERGTEGERKIDTVFGCLSYMP